MDRYFDGVNGRWAGESLEVFALVGIIITFLDEVFEIAVLQALHDREEGLASDHVRVGLG